MENLLASQAVLKYLLFAMELAANAAVAIGGVTADNTE